MAQMPIAMLLSPYWAQPALTHHPYVSCLRSRGIQMGMQNSTLLRCQSFIAKVCASAFTTNPRMGHTRMLNCSAVLYHHGKFTDRVIEEQWREMQQNSFMKKAHRKFYMYFMCLKNYEARARRCATSHLDKTCRHQEVRAVTTVRGSTWMARSLLEMHSGFKLVHLVRDPRAVTYHRLQSGNAQLAFFESSETATLAETYCDLALRQVTEMLSAKATYEQRVIGLAYDKFLHRISENFFKLLQYMGVRLSVKEAGNLIKILCTLEVKLIASNYYWSVDMSPANITAINRRCQMLIDEITQNKLSKQAISSGYFL